MDQLVFITCKRTVIDQLSEELGDYLHEYVDIIAIEQGLTDHKREGYISIACKGTIPPRFRVKVGNDPDIFDYTIHGQALAEVFHAQHVQR